MAPPPKRSGIGAIGRTKMVNLHPSQPLRDKFGTQYERDYLDGLIIIGRSRGKVSRKGRIVNRFEVQHPDLPNVDLFYVAASNLKILEEGPIPFDDDPPVPLLPPILNVELIEDQPLTQPERNLHSEDIAELRAQGITVDDDNEPDELNAADPGPPPVGTWGKPAACRGASQGHLKLGGKWAGMSWATVAELDELRLFMLCFPMDYIQNVLLPETNKYVSVEISLRGFFVFLGCLFFMACHPVDGERDVWWSKESISPKAGAPFRLNNYITRNRFKEIMRSIRYTSKPQPAY
jgi:hypothetical protein